MGSPEYALVLLDSYSHMPVRGFGGFVSEEDAWAFYKENFDGYMAAVVPLETKEPPHA